MPRLQPFTQLCRQLAQPRRTDRADLHLHTTASDGAYAAKEIVDLAQRAGLAAIALTDHDTTAGLDAARGAAGPDLEIIVGVEITTVFQGRSLHLLGYFFRPDDLPLQHCLEKIRTFRVERFREMVERLKQRGVSLDESAVQTQLDGEVPGRRHLAQLLVNAKKAATVRDAFLRYLPDHGDVAVPASELDVGQAIARVRSAGGVAAWAHPPYDDTRERLLELRRLGLQAVEVEYPNVRGQRLRELRGLASELELAITGGSDCHGPHPPQRTVGASTISSAELDALRRLAT